MNINEPHTLHTFSQGPGTYITVSHRIPKYSGWDALGVNGSPFSVARFVTVHSSRAGGSQLQMALAGAPQGRPPFRHFLLQKRGDVMRLASKGLGWKTWRAPRCCRLDDQRCLGVLVLIKS